MKQAIELVAYILFFKINEPQQKNKNKTTF